MAAKGSNVVRKVAKERIAILYKLAKENLHKEDSLSIEYIKNLRRISEHYKIRLDPEMKVSICKNCNLPLIPGDNAQLRIIGKEKRRVYRCKTCGRTNSQSFRP